MGAAVATHAIEGFDTYNTWYYGRQSLLLAKEGHQVDLQALSVAQEAYHLDQRAMTIETVNAIREDARDLFQARAARLDNLMVVVTLMLTVGFGFVVEGTFPPENAMPEAKNIVIAYACFCALALLCPFFSLICVMQCKSHLDSSFDSLIREINKILDTLLKELFAGETHLQQNNPKHLEEILSVNRDGWDHRCDTFFKLGQGLFMLSLLVAMVLCCLLLGLYYRYTYHSDLVWRFYVYIVAGGTTLGLLAMCLHTLYDTYGRSRQDDISRELSSMSHVDKSCNEIAARF